ncbi:hypothetical protein ECZU36_19950 [Escherichia coli]|nr:hypothetical protein ECZU36_19950 [Escherichia coli]
MTTAPPLRAPELRWNQQKPVSASKAAIEAARTNIIQAQTRVEAAQATERRIAADIDDSELKAPRDGRVQYRVAERAKCWRQAVGC